jgi:hypothetical protein
MPVSTTAPQAVTAFPKAAVEARLRGELLKSVIADASLRGIALPAAASAQSGISIQIDSLVVVSLLCAVEPILGFELKDSVVRPGGYSSINQAIDQVMPRIEKHWQKHRKGGKK